jgi:hypothetical protein
VCLKTENDYKMDVEIAEAEFGPGHIMVGGALVNLAEFYDRQGMRDQASDCDERIRILLEQYLSRKHKED